MTVAVAVAVAVAVELEREMSSEFQEVRAWKIETEFDELNYLCFPLFC